MIRQNWTRPELLAAFSLYCETPFGRLHSGNSQIIELAQKTGRTPNAVAMKMVNFASLDPIQIKRGVVGLANTSKADKELMAQFSADPESVVLEIEDLNPTLRQSKTQDESILDNTEELPSGPTEKERVVRVRVVQRFFRNTVLSSYDFKCACCALNIPELLNASHIIPWKSDESRRADPKNGLSLCALHDRAFDRGLMTIDDDLLFVLSKRLKTAPSNDFSKVAFEKIEGQSLILPQRFSPDVDALQFHRDNIFQG